MPDSFYILARYWMRVDGVMLRVCDTRVWGRADHPHVLRECTRREATFDELKAVGKEVDAGTVHDPNKFAHLLPVVSSVTEAIHFGEQDPAPSTVAPAAGAGAATGAATGAAEPASSLPPSS